MNDAATPVAGDLIPLDKIRLDGDTQPRAAINDEVVGQYAEGYRESHGLPAAVVFFDGACYWLADGFHRYHARVQAGFADLPCEVRPGGLSEARWHAAGANKEHRGLYRSNADKRRAVEMALKARPEASDHAVARQCGVSQPYVGVIRGQLAGQLSNSGNQMRVVQRAGKVYQMDTSGITGRPRTPPELEDAEVKPDVVVETPGSLAEKERQAAAAGNYEHAADLRDERLSLEAPPEGEAAPGAEPPPPQYPHSERVAYWLSRVLDQIADVPPLLAQPDLWRPRDVRAVVLPRLRELRDAADALVGRLEQAFGG